MPRTLRSLYERHYAPLRLGTASESCRYQYTRNIAAFSKWLGHDAEVGDLSDDNLAAFASYLVRSKRSPATANKMVGQLKALWGFAAKRNIVAAFPTWQKLQEYRRVPTAWTKEQLAALFKAIRSLTGTVGQSHTRDFWAALHCVLWDTGLRIGAVMKAEWSDLDGEYLLVRAETQKDKEEQRFKLHKDTLAALAKIHPKTGRLLPWPNCYLYLWTKYKAILERAGLPHGRRDKFHRMRRTVASWFEACGGNATELLGHSDRRVTKAYLDPNVTGKPHASDLLFRPTG